MIGAWLAAKGLLGLKNQWWVLIFAVIATAALTVIAIADNAVEDTLDTAKQAGSAEQQVRQQSESLSQVERANNAEQEVHRSDAAARYDRCVRNSTEDTRANCDRFKPVSR